jgi:predicted dehydrogenase
MPQLIPRIAVIGCGAIAETFYLPALAKHDSICRQLVLVDRNLERIRKLGEQFQIKDYATDYGEIRDSVNGAIIAVPHHLHYSISSSFISAGVHILSEKPLAETGEQVKELIRSAEKHGVTISVNNVRRLYPSYAKVKELLSASAIGEVSTITFLEGDLFNWPTTSGFYFDSHLSRKGVLIDLGAHVLDIICWWLGGKPTIVSCKIDSFGGCEAVASVSLDYAGCGISIRLSRLARLPNLFRIKGEKGTVEGGTYDWRRLAISTQSAGKKEIKFRLQGRDSFDFADMQVGNFLRLLKNQGKPLVSAVDVLDSIELLDEAYSRATRFSLPWYDLTSLAHEARC